MLSFSVSGTYADLYEITMGQTYFLEGRHAETACFDYFFRKIPNNGGYVLFAGLHDLLEALEGLQFTDEDIAYLQELRLHPDYLDFLKSFRFKGTLHAPPEGEVIFPHSPIVRVEGTLLETQLIESLLLNILNFASLVATKASRIRQVAGNRTLSDFGLRRAHGPGAVLAARAAVVGGFNSTSNTYAALKYGIPAAGTMAHSFIESYDAELEAFRAFARSRPDDCIFLVDTYHTLQSGVPNAITVAKELEAQGHKAVGIRLDSGDLAYLAKAARNMLNEAGFPYVKIITSNQLDEFVIRSLLEQQAPIDVFGVGTKLVTGAPDAALDGVYKLAMAAGKARLKLSESKEKTTLPGIKQVLRTLDEEGKFYGADAVILASEGNHADLIRHPVEEERQLYLRDCRQEPLLQKVMENGQRTAAPPALAETAAYAQKRLRQLPEEYKRLENPHLYKVGISPQLWELREQLKAHFHK
ncbi:nicotinate phosphoribosyltransferase [Pontibacter mangrovi]|uniref:Nicotinate phosphoribosyltransferase n=1 Tax=Pontibacter mangrovi TaxID=2589816 RepID=A0A501WBS6_9BACT|nr:nicotinate phosphoribosyltransferase [Pontibacter mangrovi]TPE46262.1 nicotinate phosphoribosyltransferase [Pontibacter mangrovi]